MDAANRANRRTLTARSSAKVGGGSIERRRRPFRIAQRKELTREPLPHAFPVSRTESLLRSPSREMKPAPRTAHIKHHMKRRPEIHPHSVETDGPRLKGQRRASRRLNDFGIEPHPARELSAKVFVHECKPHGQIAGFEGTLAS